ncbi:hypothetical protein HDV02_005896 [Globomyces sp. JEL0801]|nr:hypothetical protein HDV02_005896 [Globomyces sp. JEL0801]
MSSRPSSRLSLSHRPPSVEVNESVTVISNGTKGIVRFVGLTEFSTGNWVGVELDEPTGKNDGSVADVRYFDCKAGHGIFVRESQIKSSNKSTDSPSSRSSLSGRTSPPSKTPPGSSKRKSPPSVQSKRLSVSSSTSSTPLMVTKPLPTKTKVIGKSLTKSTSVDSINQKIHRKDSLSTVEESSNLDTKESTIKSSKSTDSMNNLPPSVGKRTSLPRPRTNIADADKKQTILSPILDSPTEPVAIKKAGLRNANLVISTGTENNFLGLMDTSPPKGFSDNENAPKSPQRDTELLKPTIQQTKTLKNGRQNSKSPIRSHQDLLSSLSIAGSIANIPGKPPSPIITEKPVPSPTKVQAFSDSILKSPKKDSALEPGILQASLLENKPDALPVTQKISKRASSLSRSRSPRSKNPISPTRNRSASPALSDSLPFTGSADLSISPSKSKSRHVIPTNDFNGNDSPSHPLSHDLPGAEIRGRSLAISDLSNELESAKAKIKSLTNRNEYLSNYNEDLFNQNQILITEKNMLESQYTTTIESVSDQEKQILELQSMLKEATHKNHTITTSAKVIKESIEGNEKYEHLKRENNRNLREIEALNRELEMRNDALEVALLDKCIAEESLDVAHSEIKQLKSTVEELTLELELLTLQPKNNENPKSSLDDKKQILQLQLQSDRLAEALIKLRDVSVSKEAEFTNHVEMQQSELQNYEEMRNSCNDLKESLDMANERIKHLKEQVDDTYVMSEMLQSITETNLKLDETLVEKKLERMELEQLLKVSNDLEKAHIELEKKLYEELEVQRENQLTISQLRRTLDNQSSVNKSKSPGLITNESDMIDLRRKLEDSNRELKKLKLQSDTVSLSLSESKKEISILKLFLAPGFDKTFGDILNSYLLFERISNKCRLIGKYIGDCLREKYHPTARALEIAASWSIVMDVRQAAKKLSVNFISKDTLADFAPFVEVYKSAAHSESLIDQHLKQIFYEYADVKSLLPELVDLSNLLQRSSTEIESNSDNLLWRQESSLLCIDTLYMHTACIESELSCISNLFGPANVEAPAEICELIKKFTNGILSNSLSVKNSTSVLQKKILETQKQTHVVSVEVLGQVVESGSSLESVVTDLRTVRNSLQSYIQEANNNSSDLSGDSIKDILEQPDIKGEKSLESVATDLKSILSEFTNMKEWSLFINPTPPWNQMASRMKEDISQLELFKNKSTALESQLVAHLKSLSQKDEIISANMVEIDILKRKSDQIEKMKAEVNTIQAKLDEAIDLKEQYHVALESINGDLLELEAENDQLKIHVSHLQKQLMDQKSFVQNSPLRKQSLHQSHTPLSLPNKSETNLQNPDTATTTSNLLVETQKICIRFLMLEIARLKGREYSSTNWQLFHPSDPLMKRSTRAQKQSPDYSFSEYVDKSKNVEISELQNQANSVLSDIYSFAKESCVIDLTNTTKNIHSKVWKPKLSDPLQQFLSKKSKLTQLQNRIQTLHNNIHESEISSHRVKSLSNKSVICGRVTIERNTSCAIESKRTIRLNSISQFQEIHNLFLF